MENAKKGLLFLKPEATLGVDPTPTPAANTIPAMRSSVQIEGIHEDGKREILDGDFGVAPGEPLFVHQRWTFQTEWVGNRDDGLGGDISAGDNSYPIKIADLFKAADFDETYTPESSGGAADGDVIYAPGHNSIAQNGVGTTLFGYFYSQNMLYKISHAKANITGITIEAGRRAYIDWEIMGAWIDRADHAITNLVATLSPVLPSTTPTPCKGAVITMSGYSIKLKSLTLQTNGALTPCGDVQSSEGIHSFVVSDFRPTGTMSVEQEKLATAPFPTDWRAGTVKDMDIAWGTQSGKRHALTMQCLWDRVPRSEENGMVMNPIEFSCVKDAPGGTYADILKLKYW